MTPTRLDDALFLACLGWPVFPVHTPIWEAAGLRCSCSKGFNCAAKDLGKHPRTQHGFKDATTDPATIRKWWTKWPDANIGIRTGAESGLVVLDIDPRNGGEDSLAELEAVHGKLPETVESLTGGGGSQLFFQHPGGYIKCHSYGKLLGPGIDVKADGGYVVVPGSLHKSGNRYAWEWSATPGEVALAPLPPWLLERLVSRECYRDTEVQRGPICTSASSAVSAISAGSVISAISVTPQQADEVAQLLIKHSPASGGQRRNCLWDIARGLKFNLGMGNRRAVEFRPLIRIWHDAVWPRTSRTKTADDSLDDFYEAWDDACVPLGGDLAAAAFAQARNDPIPPSALEAFTDPVRHLVAAACRRMQLMVGDTDFSLSSRQVATQLGLSGPAGHVHAHRLQRSLERPRIVRNTFRGKAGPGGKDTAARWRYIAPDLHDQLDAGGQK